MKLTDIQVPNNILEDLQIPKWKQAVNEEIRALEENGTWDVVNLPLAKNPVRCKWIFTIKHKVDGSVERFKA